MSAVLGFLLLFEANNIQRLDQCQAKRLVLFSQHLQTSQAFMGVLKIACYRYLTVTALGSGLPTANSTMFSKLLGSHLLFVVAIRALELRLKTNIAMFEKITVFDLVRAEVAVDHNRIDLLLHFRSCKSVPEVFSRLTVLIRTTKTLCHLLFSEMLLANQSFASKTFKGLVSHISAPKTNKRVSIVCLELVLQIEM